MPSGATDRLAEVPPQALAIVTEARRAVFSTVDDGGEPHSVPVTFALVDGELVTAIDQKPKSTRRPARLLYAQRRGVATLLFDRWDEAWDRLGWVMVTGRVRVMPPGWGRDELAARYPQYEDDPPAGESIVITPVRVRWWTWE